MQDKCNLEPISSYTNQDTSCCAGHLDKYKCMLWVRKKKEHGILMEEI